MNTANERTHSNMVLKYRTIFISDVHIGTSGSQTELLLDFLKRTESENLFLVGDIIDGWRLKKRWYWPQSHNDVLQKLLRKARKGTKVVFIPGNHDDFARDYNGTCFGEIQVKNSTTYRTIGGLTYLVIHGDKLDGVVGSHGRLIAHFGGWAYDTTIVLNQWLNLIRRRLNLNEWSLAAFVKQRVGQAAKLIDNFEIATAKHAGELEMDGVICGHIHHPAMRTIDGIKYINDGDWVENGTALVEDLSGNLLIIKWSASAPPEILFSSNHGD